MSVSASFDSELVDTSSISVRFPQIERETQQDETRAREHVLSPRERPHADERKRDCSDRTSDCQDVRHISTSSPWFVLTRNICWHRYAAIPPRGPCPPVNRDVRIGIRMGWMRTAPFYPNNYASCRVKISHSDKPFSKSLNRSVSKRRYHVRYAVIPVRPNKRYGRTHVRRIHAGNANHRV